MRTETTTPCTSWISGKHSEDVEINTRIPYVAIFDFFAQGDEADQVINEINTIYNTTDCTPLEACMIWARNI